MPIGYRRNMTGSRGVFYIPNSTANGAIREGAAIATVNTGTIQLEECSASSNATAFVGFANTAAGNGDAVGVVSLRGSTVTPIVEGGGALTAGDPVWLSSTLGEVTQTAPTSDLSLRCGMATSTTEMILSSDVQIDLG